MASAACFGLSPASVRHVSGRIKFPLENFYALPLSASISSSSSPALIVARSRGHAVRRVVPFLKNELTLNISGYEEYPKIIVFW
ncbi:MAG TPA: hypothetical protein VGX71_21315 [Pseudaminobacter sp.]|nr:hypothetical protein [Pseudaminobacter sp.]